MIIGNVSSESSHNWKEKRNKNGNEAKTESLKYVREIMNQIQLDIRSRLLKMCVALL